MRAYLEIEALRLGDRLTTELQVSESSMSVMIPILSIQPLVENAVKHGVAVKGTAGRVIVRVQNDEGISLSVSKIPASGFSTEPLIAPKEWA